MPEYGIMVVLFQADSQNEGSRVVNNLVDRLSEEEVAKEEGKRQREDARATRGGRGGGGGGGRMGQRGGAVIGS